MTLVCHGWICNGTFSWVQFLSNKLELIRFLQCKDYKNILLFALFWYELFYKNLIVLHHADNNFLFYFDICIKFTFSLIISTIKKWQHLTWFVLFYDKNMFERKKHSTIVKFRIQKDNSFKRIIKFRNYLPSVNLSLKSWFSGAAVHRCFSK